MGASSTGFPAFACSSGIVGSLVATAFFVTVFSFFASSSDGASLSCSAEFTLSANFVFLGGERRRFGFVSFNVSSPDVFTFFERWRGGFFSSVVISSVRVSGAVPSSACCAASLSVLAEESVSSATAVLGSLSSPAETVSSEFSGLRDLRRPPRRPRRRRFLGSLSDSPESASIASVANSSDFVSVTSVLASTVSVVSIASSSRRFDRRRRDLRFRLPASACSLSSTVALLSDGSIAR